MSKLHVWDWNCETWNKFESGCGWQCCFHFDLPSLDQFLWKPIKTSETVLFHGTFLHLTVVLVFYAGSSYYVSVSVGPGSGSGSALVHMTSQQQSLPTTGWESTWSKMAAPRYLLLLVILGFASPALAGFRQAKKVLKSFYKIFPRCTLGEWACTASCVTLGQTSGLCTDEGFLFHSACNFAKPV